MLKPNTLLGRPNAVRPALNAKPVSRWPAVVSKRRVPYLLQNPRQLHLCRVAQGVATPPTPASAPPATESNIGFKKGFWTFVDVVAILGSVGGALAAILNLFSGTYVLFLPLVLPVISLLSALQREGLIAEDNRRAYDKLRVSLTRDSSALLADARGALEEVRRELRGQNTTAARLGAIEARLSSLEGSILSAGRSAREAAAGLGVLPERLQVEQRAVLEGLVAAMRVELRRAAESLANNETTALARLDARLAAVEGSLSGLEVAQSEGLRRLSMSLNSALADAEATLQSSVRNEVARSMEPVRRLPQMLAAALPPALAAAEAVEASAAGGGPAAAAGAAGAMATSPPGVTPEQVQAIVSQEVEVAVVRILDFQADNFGRLNSVRPVPMDEEQWAALGRRLTRLERLVEGVPTGTEGALLQGGQVPAAVAAAVGQALAVQVAEARAEVAAAAAREAESVRNDILAAQTVLRESFDGLAAALQPLQLGVTELQLAVAAVADVQQQLAQQAATQAAAEGSKAAVEVTALPPAELVRLLEGLEAVGGLLRDVDRKMDGVTAAMDQLPAAAAAATAPPPPPPHPPARDTVEEAAAAAVANRQQQLELQASMEAMKEALAALTSQIGLMANRSEAAPPPPPPPPLPSAGDATVDLSAITGGIAGSAGGSSGGGVIADMLSFEASLTSTEPAAPPERGGNGDSRRLPSTVGVTRDEAYEMMQQLAEARRRSGSEASSSSGGGGGCDACKSDGTSDGTSGSAAAAIASIRTVEPQLRIEGLPPFESPVPDDATAAATANADLAPASLSQVPPMQSEMEQQPPSSPPLQQQQQQQSMEALWQQPAEPTQLDMPFTQAATTAAGSPPPQLPPPPATTMTGAAAAPAAAADGTVMPTADALQLPYGEFPSMPYTEASVAPVYQAVRPAPFPRPFSPSETSYVPFPQPLPVPPNLPPAAMSGFPPGEMGYAPQGEMYGWDQRRPQQQQQQQQQQRMPYSPYDQQLAATQGGGLPGGLREGSFGYAAANPSALSPATAAATAAGGLPIEQPSEASPWYSMPQLQQQFTAVAEAAAQPTPFQKPPSPPLSQAPPLSPPPPPQAPPPQQQQKQRPQLRLPFWPSFPQPAQAAAAPPPPQPRAGAAPQSPPMPPQQPPTSTSSAAATASTQPRSGISAWFPTLPPAPGFGPVPTPPMPTPSPQQQAARAGAPAAVSAAASAPTPVAAAPPLPPLTAPADYRPRPLDGLSVNEMISEGLRLLRLGREETRKGEDYGLADTLIQGSIAAFTRASEQPAPDTKALGNLGNALLARGELKAAYLEALRSSPPPASASEAATQLEAERAMTLEATGLLTEAGAMFLRVLELEGWSSRALVNWGRALVIRADLLAATPEGLTPGSSTLPVVAQLYTSAIDKFEGVLEGEPDMVPAKYRCALAMAGLSRTKPPGSRERLTLLADSINYLRDVVASQSADAEALRPSALTALQQYEAQLVAQRAGRQ